MKNRKLDQHQMEVVQDVLQGRYGNGYDRNESLRDAGYDPNEIQEWVNATILSNMPLSYRLKSQLRCIRRKIKIVRFKIFGECRIKGFIYNPDFPSNEMESRNGE